MFEFDRRGSRKITLALMIALAAGFARAEDAPAAAPERPLPPAVAGFLGRIQSEARFQDCVGAAVTAQHLSDDDLIRRIAEKGLAAELYASVSEGEDDPDAALAESGFAPKHRDPDELLAEKSIAFAKLATERALADELPPPGLLRPTNRLFIGINEAVDAKCEVPEHLRPGGDRLRAEAEAIAPLLVEAARVTECADAAAARRGSDQDGAYVLIDKSPFAADFRRDVLAVAAALAPEDRVKLEKSDASMALGRGLLLLTATSFDLGLMTKAQGVNAIYLDRALDSGCAPSEALKTYIGADNRANH